MIQQQTSDPDFIPAGSSPDFIPATASSAAPDFVPFQASQAPPESQSSAMMRFIKAAGARLYAGTAGAGPQQSGTMTQDFSQQQAQAKAGTLPSAWQTLKNSASDASPSNIDIGRTISSVNPIDAQRFQSGDVAGGLGASGANLLMLLKGLQQAKGGKVPVYGARPSVQPPAPLALPAAPIELGPSSITPQTQEGLLPAARKVFDDGRVQYLTRPLRPGESPDVYKNTNTNVQEYFIQKMRRALEQPTVSGASEQEAAMQRMAEYAKTPVDKMQGSASGPVEPDPGGHAGNEVTSAEELNRPGTNYVISKSGQLTYHGKAFSPESTPSGASHVTALPDGTLRVNAGPALSPAQEMAVRRAVTTPTPRVPTSDADMMDLLMKSVQKAGGKARAAKAGDD